MSIKIHHGANGSYKTSGAIQDDAIPAIHEGRIVITNVRGFTRESVLEAFPDLPDRALDSFDVLNLSMESIDDLDQMRRWFMWAPRGAFLIFDETQILFPKSWKEKDLEQFDYPGGIEEAKKADRPTGWLDAWTRHRHWNWDVVLTTPNIRYIREDIRLTCEKAYLHSNLAVIGIPGRYKEAMHDAQENKPPMDGSTIVTIKKIKPSTFRVYQSTATGKVQDTKAGKNLFLSPKVLGLLVLIAGLAISLVTSDGIHLFRAQPPAVAASTVAPAAAAVPGAAVPSSAAVAPRPVAPAQGAIARPRVEGHPLAGYAFTLQGVLTGIKDGLPRQVVLFELRHADGRYFHQTADDLRLLGYRVQVKTNCVVELAHRDWKTLVFCGVSPSSKEQGLVVQAPAGLSGSVQSEGRPAPPTTL